MAHRVECGKFKVLEVSLTEITQIGGLGICDYCAKPSFNGFLIPVLNRWFCPKCYEEWKSRAVYYPEDKEYEDRKFNQYCKALGL